MSEKVLIVDDEIEILSLIEEALKDEGYDVITADNANDAIYYAKSEPDLIILDVMMPGRDGFYVCQTIRDLVSCPIVFLSARSAEADRVKGLAYGADDYLTKPFSLKELKARVNAHIRREHRRKSQSEAQLLRFGQLVIDVRGYTIKMNDQQIPLTHREFDIVQLLALHYGQVFSRDQIYEKVWGIDAMGDATTVTEHIKKIRAKLSVIDPETQYITTVWGVGYRWEINGS